jgi:hypothetical protein
VTDEPSGTGISSSANRSRNVIMTGAPSSRTASVSPAGKLIRYPAGGNPLPCRVPGPHRGFPGHRRVYPPAGLPADPAAGRSPCCAALFLGGSAPDALRHGLKGVGQAVCADGATAADRLRRFGLPHRRACCRRNGKEHLGIHLPAGAARYPAQGARPGRYRQHCKPPASLRRCRDPALTRVPGPGALAALARAPGDRAVVVIGTRERARGTGVFLPVPP